MTALGFVVLARRPNPNGGHTLEPVSAVFNGPKALERAQNVVESLTARHKRSEYDDDPFVSDSYLRYNELVEYVIGEIRAVHRCGHCGRDSGHDARCPGQLT